MATKAYSTFPKAPGQEPQIQMKFSVIPRTLVRGGLTAPQSQPAYSTIPANRVGISWGT